MLVAAADELAVELLGFDELELELLPQPATTIMAEIQAAAATPFHLFGILFLSLVYDVVVPRDSCARVQMGSRVRAHKYELD